MAKRLRQAGTIPRRIANLAWNRELPQGAGWNQSFSASLVDLIFPPTCLLCGDEILPGGARFCHRCHHEMAVSRESSCRRCARPLPPGTSDRDDGCPHCRDKRFRFERTVALGIYGGIIRDLVLKMKQAQSESLTLAAGTVLAERVRRQLGESLPDVVTPVPMHWFRRLTRGVNDAELLAESIALRLGRPRNTALIHCRRPTKKQGTLWPTERRRNVRGAYGISTRYRPLLRGAHVLVVDDVMTTGATANELSRVLRHAGAERISIAVIARGVGFD